MKHKNLSIELQRMWNMKCFAVPVMTGATAIITRGIKMYLEAIAGQRSIDSLQKQLCCEHRA
jgi:hypothetical protein